MDALLIISSILLLAACGLATLAALALAVMSNTRHRSMFLYTTAITAVVAAAPTTVLNAELGGGTAGDMCVLVFAALAVAQVLHNMAKKAMLYIAHGSAHTMLTPVYVVAGLSCLSTDPLYGALWVCALLSLVAIVAIFTETHTPSYNALQFVVATDVLHVGAVVFLTFNVLDNTIGLGASANSLLLVVASLLYFIVQHIAFFYAFAEDRATQLCNLDLRFYGPQNQKA